MAYKNPEIAFSLVDVNEERVEAWNSNRYPIFEPGLEELLSDVKDGCPRFAHSCFANLDPALRDVSHSIKKLARLNEFKKRSANLTISKDVAGCIAEAEMVFICVNTPAKVSSRVRVPCRCAKRKSQRASGDYFEIDLGFHNAAVEAVVGASSSPKILVVKSTVPCGTADRVEELVSGRHARGTD